MPSSRGSLQVEVYVTQLRLMAFQKVGKCVYWGMVPFTITVYHNVNVSLRSLPFRSGKVNTSKV